MGATKPRSTASTWPSNLESAYGLSGATVAPEAVPAHHGAMPVLVAKSEHA